MPVEPVTPPPTKGGNRNIAVVAIDTLITTITRKIFPKYYNKKMSGITKKFTK